MTRHCLPSAHCNRAAAGGATRALVVAPAAAYAPLCMLNNTESTGSVRTSGEAFVTVRRLISCVCLSSGAITRLCADHEGDCYTLHARRIVSGTFSGLGSIANSKALKQSGTRR